MYKFIFKTFDQLKNDNLDQVKFDQVIIPQYFFHFIILSLFLTKWYLSALIS